HGARGGAGAEPAVFNEQRIVMPAILAARPAQRIPIAGEVEVACRFEREAEPALDLTLDPVEPLVVDRVLEAGAGAVGAVAEIALHAHHYAADLVHPVLGD